ncbi:MAG: [protein-PII] uridylyltransferase [Pirellulales bacterium]|nr:[protein-PII] uridylyltransferase [Pirellulales bacterium]
MAGLRPSVLAARARLADGHEQLRNRHQDGCPGPELSAAITDLRDQVLLALFEAALADLPAAEAGALRRDVVLVAHGGYGRRDVAPYSDVDLMVLVAPGSRPRTGPLAERFMCDVFDCGLMLGQSVRTAEEACRLACQDPRICTSLVESRLLAGDPALFEQFLKAFHRRVRGHSAGLLGAIQKARLEERIKFGETVFLLEPNVKRSRGALRDIHLLRWAGMVRYGASRPEELRRLDVLSEEDFDAVVRAGEFLLWLRNEMHFHAGKSGDVLDRAEQLRIARLLRYEPAAGMLPVEQFMRDYFRHTDQVSHITTRFLEAARPDLQKRAMSTKWFGHRVQGGYRVGPSEILADRHGLRRLRGNLTPIMELVDLANLYDKQIAAGTWEAVRREVASLSQEIPLEARDHFLSLLSHPRRLGELLRGLHEVGILERFVPAFAHARGLLQFNQYHKYTVDEHCLRAVEHATEFSGDPGPLGNVYRGIQQKRILHLALLIHDLGKGYPEDHCEVGARIARETAQRLGLETHEAESLEFLVGRHLLMNHLAFRRDTSDEQLIVRFAVEVGSPELMRMLYILTAADLAAVGPGSWNGWKAEVITDLYHRTMKHLAGESLGTSAEEHQRSRRGAVRAALRTQGEDPWFVRHIDALPASFLNGTPPNQLAEDLRLLHALRPGEVNAQAVYQPETSAVLFTIGTNEDVTPGIFHRLTGALASHGLQILSAEINTLLDGLILDRFWVHDPDYAGEPPPERLEAIRSSLVESLTATDAKPPSFRRTWQMGSRRVVAHRLETRVHVDNSTSDRFTILDIFTADRRGLLYTITRTLYELGLSVARAKIGTFLDQVVDVFYVTGRHGAKIQDDRRLETIRCRLLEIIDASEPD